jgi:hypothetical protein
MSKTEEGEERRPSLAARSRAPIVITLLFVGVVGVVYYAYYRKQTDYFAGRDLRLLSMLTAQMAGRVDMYTGFIRNGEQPDKFGTCPDATEKGATFERDLVETSGGWSLAMEDDKAKCFAISLDSIVAPVMARRVGAAFDMLIVAQEDKDGTVLYSTAREAKKSTLLQKEEESDSEDIAEPHVGEADGAASAAARSADDRRGPDVLITHLTAFSRHKGWNDSEALNLVNLTHATGRTEVNLGGTNYVLFTQPYTFANAKMTQDHKARRWIVCGLVSASRFRYDASAVSTSIILLAMAVVLLALCGWPFLRIALIDPRQALTITDVVLVVICTIVGAAVITLALLDASAYRTMSRLADDQLRDYSDRLQQNFGRNVVRATEMLDEAERQTVELARKASFGGTCGEALKTPSEVPEGSLLTAALFRDAMANYPYIHSVFWISESGMQSARFDRVRSSLQCVSDRQYFQMAKAQQMWTMGKNEYALEWVRSKTTGEVRAVFAKRTKYAPFAVVAASTELIDITYAVGPPGVEMAIIDEKGEVVYHSDPQRIGYENFFAEADRDRDLRAAVIARRAEPLNVTYWGEDQAMFVQPLQASPWTLVTFRPKRLTRVLNVEGALLTLALLLMCAVPYLLLFVGVLLIFPRYRAPRLWPDISRTRDYLRLCIILAAMLVLFAMDVHLLTPWSSFFGILIIPNLAMVTAYLVLHRTGSPGRYNIATAVWIAINAAFFAHLFVAKPAPLRGLGEHPLAVKLALVASALAVAVLTQQLLSRRTNGIAQALSVLSTRIGYSRLYRLCGVLLLAVGVAIPVVGYFAISRNVQSELLVKYAQLRAAADLEHRMHHLEELNALTSNSPDVDKDLRQTPLTFFGSRWNLDLVPIKDQPATAEENDDSATTIPEAAATTLPVLYEDSLAIRPLFGSRSADDLWTWKRTDHGTTLELTRKIRLDVGAAHMLWPHDEHLNKQQTIVIKSTLPHTDSRTALMHLGAGAIIGLPLLAAFWFAVTFIARRVLLIDVTEPDWLAPLPLSPSLGDHIFLVRRDRDAQQLTGNDPTGNGLPFFDVSFEELDRTGGWDDVLQTLDSSEAGRNVRVVDFEYGINDGDINEKKLRWLERLLSLPDRTMIIVSTVTPAYLMTTAPPEGADDAAAYFNRWRALIERFVCITAEELMLRHDEWQRRRRFRTVSQLSASAPKSWLEKETAYNSVLRQLAREIEAEAKERSDGGHFDADADREHLLDEIGERAETYYAGLWASCQEAEKLLLFQLANDGLANGRNRRLLRRLIARGLVRRDPNLELFSESFRRYVLGAGRREDLVKRAREERGASTWDSLRVPFFIIIISFLLLLFATQKDLLTTTTALATALTTGLPVMMKIIGAFTERRADGGRA